MAHIELTSSLTATEDLKNRVIKAINNPASSFLANSGEVPGPVGNLPIYLAENKCMQLALDLGMRGGSRDSTSAVLALIPYTRWNTSIEYTSVNGDTGEIRHVRDFWQLEESRVSIKLDIPLRPMKLSQEELNTLSYSEILFENVKGKRLLRNTEVYDDVQVTANELFNHVNKQKLLAAIHKLFSNKAMLTLLDQQYGNCS